MDERARLPALHRGFAVVSIETTTRLRAALRAGHLRPVSASSSRPARSGQAGGAPEPPECVAANHARRRRILSRCHNASRERPRVDWTKRNIVIIGILSRPPPITPERRERLCFVLDTLRERTELVFTDLFPVGVTRPQILVTFLAILELVRTRMIRLHQEEPFGPIVMNLAVSADAPLPESLEQL